MPVTITVDTTRSGLPTTAITKQRKKLHTAIDACVGAAALPATQRFDTPYAFINTPLDTEALTLSTTLATRHADASLVVLVGIGGSNLGTLAVYHAIRGSLAHISTRKQFLCADTVDANALATIGSAIRNTRASGSRVLLIIVSKSGTTTETVADASILLDILMQGDASWPASVVAITDQGSALWHFAHERGIDTLPIPALVGGRYSVLTSVGLFPLATLEIDTSELLRGAHAMRELVLEKDLRKNPAALLALAQYHHATSGTPRKNITETFVFGSDFEYLGRWYRQLLGESCGKEFAIGKGGKNGKKINAGLTPTLCVGSTDLHSVGQLALGGPADKFTIFIESARAPPVIVPRDGPLTGLVPAVAGKDVHAILRAIAEGTRKAYDARKRPYASIVLSNKGAHAIGELLMLQMAQTVYLAALFGVNPFDQPAVEEYKKHTRDALTRSA